MNHPTFKEKGQLFSGDIAIATILFLSALALAFFLWNNVTDNINHAESLRNLQKVSSEAVEQLIRTPGIPEDWDIYTVIVPGLATRDREINSTKALAFINLTDSNVMDSNGDTNYDKNRYLMGLGEYNFHMNVTYLSDSTTVVIDGKPFVAGKSMFGINTTDTIAVPRTAVFNNSIVRISFVVWK